MDWTTFRALEAFNIQYDALIDQEQRGDLLAQLSLADGAGAEIADPSNMHELDVTLRLPDIRVTVVSDGIELSASAEAPVERAWALILLVKRLRAHLQTTEQPPSGLLNRLGEHLVGSLALLPEHDPEPHSEWAQARRTVALALLNEVCACYKHELSVGYAEQAIARINQWTKPGQNIYELVALLNRGLGYAHMHRHEEALRDLDQVIDAFDRWERNHYVVEGGPYLSGALPKIDEVGLKTRWARYVLAPAIMHKAEVLSDLNRSTEQLPLLRRLDDMGCEYWKRRGQLLEALARMDGNLWERDAEGQPLLAVVEDVNGWLEATYSDKYSLRQKRLQVLRKYCLERIRFTHQPDEDGTVPAFPSGEMYAAFQGLVEFQEQSGLLGHDEPKDAYLLWIDYYELFTGLEGYRQWVRVDDIDKVKDTADFFAKSSWFPDEAKSRERLLAALQALGHEDLRSTEAELLRRILADTDIALWQKAKAARRLQRLGEPIEDYSALRLPSAEEAQQVVSVSKDVFCEPDCEHLDEASDAACVLPGCRTNTYQQVLRTNNTRFLQQLIYPSIRTIPDAYCLTVLRRWQSYTPALSTGIQADSRGGGYFVYRTGSSGRVDEGIVVDPGFDFVENFLREGFSIRDIHAVVMTHAHVDHTADFLPLITLVVEYNKNRRKEGKSRPEKRILAAMSRGTFERFEKAIAASRQVFSDVLVLDPGVCIDEGKPRNDWFEHMGQLRTFRLQVRFALHNDTTPSDSVGLVVYGLDETLDWTPIVGFTGDTMWWPGIAEQYKDVPTLCANLGGVVPFGKKYGDDHAEMTIPRGLLNETGPIDIVDEENHLYWPGFSLLTQSLDAKVRLVVVTELGEELKGGLRTDIVRRLREVRGAPSYLPEDIGLTVSLLEQPEVACLACGRTVRPEHMDFSPFGREESTYYVCKPCWKYRKESVQESITDYHNNGWPLRVDENG